MKIWTIDFDIIMAPSIELYNDLIEDRKDIQSVIRMYPGLEYCLPADLAIYNGITMNIMALLKQLSSNDVYFVREHQDICKVVEDLDEFDLVNVDHHHDVGYGAGATVSNKVRRPESGNWVKYLKEQSKLKEYTWIHDARAVRPSLNLSKAFIDNEIGLEQYAGKFKADKLILCQSPQWIPASYLHLYYTWMSICEEYYGKQFKFVEVEDGLFYKGRSIEF